uniref:Ig-like domain-containing protein n=1 Tax=Knipowitschia caucasica TaxID=637954 RepID=A0AAV2KYV0_KNICA
MCISDTLCLLTSTLCLLTSTLCLLTSTLCLLTSTLCRLTSTLCLLTSTLCLLTSTLCLLTSTLCHLTSTLCLLTSTLCRLTSTLCLLTSTLCHMTSTLCLLTSTLCLLTSTLCHLTSTLCLLTSTLCRLTSTLCLLTSTLCLLTSTLCHLTSTLCLLTSTLCLLTSTLCLMTSTLCLLTSTLCRLTSTLCRLTSTLCLLTSTLCLLTSTLCLLTSTLCLLTSTLCLLTSTLCRLTSTLCLLTSTLCLLTSTLCLLTSTLCLLTSTLCRLTSTLCLLTSTLCLLTSTLCHLTSTLCLLTSTLCLLTSTLCLMTSTLCLLTSTLCRLTSTLCLLTSTLCLLTSTLCLLTSTLCLLTSTLCLLTSTLCLLTSTLCRLTSTLCLLTSTLCLLTSTLCLLTSTLCRLTSTLCLLTSTLCLLTSTLCHLTSTLCLLTSTLCLLTSTLCLMTSTLCLLTSTLCRLTSTLCLLTSTLCLLTSTLCLLTSTLCRLTSTLCRLTSTLCRLTSTLCLLTSTLCRLTSTLCLLTSTLCFLTSTLCLLTSTLCRLTSTLCLLTSTLCLLTSTLCCLTSTLCLLTSTLCRLTSTLCRLTSTLCLLTSTLCRLTSTLCLLTSTLSITWYKDGRPVTGAAGVTVARRGQLLEIEQAQLSDAGEYKCVAVNLAGVAEMFHSLHVLVPPVISSRGGTVTVVVNEAVRLECEATGVPLPSLTWLQDGSPVASLSHGIQVESGGRLLSMSSAQVTDTGRYTCVAVNAGGEQQKHYDLRVFVPPNIKGEEVNATVMLGDPVELHCQSDAVPPPVLSWRKDGRPLFRKLGLTLSEDGSQLKVARAQLQDSGRYTCEATNVAGKTDKNYNLHVWVSPSIRGSEEVSALTVTEGGLISLVCESSGIPPPSLTWRRNGKELRSSARVKVLSGGRQLQISSANRTDSASYTCSASSASGTSAKEYSLQVYVRPYIQLSDGYSEDITVIKGGTLSLQCAPEGVPRPAVTWFKDGRPIAGHHGARVLNEGRLLQIKDAQVTDTGRYTCIAVNVAGQADSRQDVSVHVPPTILGEVQFPDNISVVLKNPVVLGCEGHGIPLPDITWLKDGQPITTSSSVRILSGGRSLRLMHSALEDSGRYTCIVSNTAGEERKDFDLNILVPPSIVDEGTVQDTKVKEKHNITLSCAATGNPVPEVRWQKDGQPLVPSMNHQIVSHGRFLHITGAQLVDTGRYSCHASNSAGDRSRHFNLNILVAPTIAQPGPEGSAEEVTVTLSSPTSLVCEVQSYPPALITWLKDGSPFESTRSVRVRPGGRTLQILHAKEEDAGRYTCVATNEAGETLKHYQVKVHVPPQINKNDLPGEGLFPKEVKIKVNSTLTLECAAQASPAPALQWFKDGQTLLADDHVSITASGRIVQIKHAQVSDTGRYTCVATNIAGEDEKDFDVNIQVPPHFHHGETSPLPGADGDVRDVILNNPVSLFCETNAVPPPTLTWYRDGRPLQSTSRVLVLPGGRVLQIPRARVEDSGRYTCVAVNEAGQDSIQYDVRVLIPPTIRDSDTEFPEEVTVLANKTTQLKCQVDGSPAPNVTWYKDSQRLSTDATHRVLSSGRILQVLTPQLADTGRYVCVAENVAGSTEKSFNLNVHLPPSFLGMNSETLTVVVNNFVSLSCEATGIPPPALSWLNEKGPVQAGSNAIITPGGRTLQILKAKVSDGGKYKCVAINPAGEAQKVIQLTVYVPPSIQGSRGNTPVVVNVLMDKDVALECESNAVPPPTLTWYKNGRVVTESPHVQIQARGQRLLIKGSEVSDTGQYVCKATNVAGQVDKNFHLNIYIPPSIDGQSEETFVETVGNPVTFACDATGIPPPRLTWLKNGHPIENSESFEMHIFSGGSKLQISRSQVSDSGTFTCVASNVEGRASKHYHLTIQVPPSIYGSEMPTEMGVLFNESIKLECQVQGNPSPTIQWLKDGHVIEESFSNYSLSISPDGSILTVDAADIAASGKYTCVATNSAGEEDRIYNLNVYVPPRIELSTEAAEEVVSVLDSSVNMACSATGSPPPQMNWLRNGLPLPVSAHIRLLSAGQMLRITRTQVSDGGTYTCVASNRAGVDNKHYNLQVHVPPSLDGAGSVEDLTAVRGNMASLRCVADGTPAPLMSWFKDGELLQSEGQLLLLNLNTTLQLSRVTVNHTGTYTCVANNSAGHTSRHFNLKVLEPPHIEGSGVLDEVSVVVNNVMELHCNASGIPTPSLTWLKDGRPLPQTNSLRLLSGGEVLRVSTAQLEDTGRYSCLANSPAGDDNKEFLVHVHVPPNIIGETTPQDTSVLLNRQITLECKSDAVPPPTLTWLKDGNPLQASPRVRVLSSGRYLQINMAELTDRAHYTCVASNVAGKTTRNFNLTVNVAPSIRQSPVALSVPIEQPVVLECVVEGVPPPRVTWRKHGAILSTNSPRYAIAEDGSLHIHSAQVTDTGRYLCMATNPAGTQRKRVDLQVHVPPSITEGHNNVTVTVNVQTTLSCEAAGIPKPTVSWRKNGRLINTDQNQNMYRLLSSGSLVVIAATVEDTAVYECVVSNEAGEDSRQVILSVHVPPSIADELTELVVMRLSSVIIPCTASGVPEPTIHWSRDGTRLSHEGQGYSLLPTGPIEIESVELSDAGRYKCTAQNAAGSTVRHVQLTVQELPVIQNHRVDLDVILNNPVTLPCSATGSPTPTISWQKEGISLPTAGGVYTVLPDGSLQISKSSVLDSGTYICVAQNSAGTALGKTKLIVQVPPVIRTVSQNYASPVDSSVMLPCLAEGTPAPVLSWRKDGQLLSESVGQRVLSSGSLQMAFLQPGDTGRYTCTAANAAGTASVDMELTVQIPPSIVRGRSEVSVVEGSQTQLVCVAEGVPQPILSWEKDGVPVSDSTGEYTVLPSGELLIDIAQASDGGSYTCVATNTVGQDTHTMSVAVHTHPVFTQLLGDVSLNKGERLLLACGATGVPAPRITWAFNNKIIPVVYNHISGHSELVIDRVSKHEAGTYTCTGENSVGVVKSVGFVYVKEPPIIDGDLNSNRIEPLGGNAILNCEVRGSPLPTIHWVKNGINIPINNRIRLLDNGSLAIYGTVAEDAGNYMCVATNDAGIMERSVTLTLQSVPSIVLEPVDTVLDAGASVVLNCQAEGEPVPMIEWSREGRPLLGNDRFSSLTNGSLHISGAQREDTAEYECVARNLLGSILVRVTLTVRVHGGYSEWSEWGPCSVSCGAGGQKRRRQCNNPTPANGGQDCTGLSSATRSCYGKPCSVDGSWSEWSAWEECSRTCGQGNRTRIRSCSDPPALHGGRPCEGRAAEVIMCSVRPCPVAGHWGPWLPWSPCSETCGKGMQSRVKLCNNPPPAFEGPQCEGSDTQTQACKERPCPVDGKWSSWVTWAACSVSCGGGTRQRTRLCASPAPLHSGRQCEGSDVQVDFCNSNPCPGGTQHRDSAQGLSTGTQHRDSAQGLSTGTQHRDSAQGHSTGTQHRDTAQGLSTGTQHRDTAQGQGLSRDSAQDTAQGLSTGTQHRDSAQPQGTQHRDSAQGPHSTGDQHRDSAQGLSTGTQHRGLSTGTQHRDSAQGPAQGLSTGTQHRDSAQGLRHRDSAQGHRHRDSAQGLSTGTQHRDSAQGLGTGDSAQGLSTGTQHRDTAQGTQHRDSAQGLSQAQGLSTGTQHRDSAQGHSTGLSTGTQHRDSAQGLSTGLSTGTQHRDSAQGHSTGDSAQGLSTGLSTGTQHRDHRLSTGTQHRDSAQGLSTGTQHREAQGLTGTQHRDSAQGLSTGTQHRDSAQGLSTGTQHRDSAQGLSTGTQHRDSAQGLSTGTQHRDSAQGLSTGTHTGTQHRDSHGLSRDSAQGDSAQGLSTGTQHRDSAQGLSTGTQHRDSAQGLSTGTQHRDSAQGLSTGTQHRDSAQDQGLSTGTHQTRDSAQGLSTGDSAQDSAQGLSTGTQHRDSAQATQHRDSAQGLSTGTQHRDSAQGLSTGTHTGTQHRDSAQGLSTGTAQGLSTGIRLRAQGLSTGLSTGSGTQHRDSAQGLSTQGLSTGDSAQGLSTGQHSTGTQHRDSAQGLSTGTQHRDSAQGLSTGDSAQGHRLSTGTQHRDSAQGLSTGTQHRDSAQGTQHRGLSTGTQHRDSAQGLSTGTT